MLHGRIAGGDAFSRLASRGVGVRLLSLTYDDAQMLEEASDRIIDYEEGRPWAFS